MITLKGKCSWFGGMHDPGMSGRETLALVHYVRQRPEVFSVYVPPDTVALGKLLNPDTFYIAMRWDYHTTTPGWLVAHQVKVSANGKSVECWPVDWGPNRHTGRICDLSPGTLKALGIETDDIVTVEIPYGD